MLDEMDLINIFRTFHPNADYNFSSAHGTFSRRDHILGHKSNLSKFKKIEIISSIFSDHNSMRLNINYKEKKKTKTVRNTNTWRFNNLFLNSQQVTEEIKGEIKNLQKQMAMKTRQLKTYGMQQSSSKREVYSNTILPQETRKPSNRQPNFTPTTTGKRRRKNSKISRRKKIIKI